MDLYEIYNVTRREGDNTVEEEDYIIKEFPLDIQVNGEKVVTLVCTPAYMKELVIGYLFSEGILSDMDDVNSIQVFDFQAFVKLKDEIMINNKLRHKIITSGCGKSTVYTDLVGSGLKKIRNNNKIDGKVILKLASILSKRSNLFKKTGGVHNSLLANLNGDIIVFREDIGRHNTVDKIIGNMILNRHSSHNKIMVVSGRVSSEILLKVARKKIPILVSRSAPTDMAVRLAYRLGITLVGFVRGKRMNLYTHVKRII